MQDIIVVEGLHDEIKIKSVYPSATCVVTNGSEVSDETIKLIKKLAETHNIIIFTDPDSPGERIRKIILEAVPTAKQAFLRKKDCISNNKRKVGIEHASKESIRESLENIFEPNLEVITITNRDLYVLGLIGNENSSKIRNKISNYLNIGKPNAKTFLKRLNLLKIDKEKLEEIICKVK